MKRRFVFIIWGIFDYLYFSCNRMIYISKNDNIFRVVHKKYTGLPLQTKSGQWIRKGDHILKIHIHNYRLAKLICAHQSEVHLAIYMRKIIRESLHGLSKYVQSLPSNYEVKGIIGTTMLNRGAERFGFTVCDVSASFYSKWKGFLYKFIYLLVHPNGWQYIQKHGKRLSSKHLIMSVDELLKHYLR